MATRYDEEIDSLPSFVTPAYKKYLKSTDVVKVREAINFILTRMSFLKGDIQKIDGFIFPMDDGSTEQDHYEYKNTFNEAVKDYGLFKEFTDAEIAKIQYVEVDDALLEEMRSDVLLYFKNINRVVARMA